MTRFGSISLLVALALTSFASPIHAESTRQQELVARFKGPEIVDKLKGGGYVVLLRHMATTPIPDVRGGVDLDDCATQRVLSDQGKQQARVLGQAFEKLGIPIGEVFVSPYCRCRDTAKLAFDVEGTRSDVLTVWDELSYQERLEKGTEIRAMLDTAPAPGTNNVLITHTGNLLWALGLDSKPEGLAHVFKPTGLAIMRPSYLGRVNPSEWRSLAGLPEVTPDVAAGTPIAPPPPPPAVTE